MVRSSKRLPRVNVDMKKVRGKAGTLLPSIIAKKRGEAFRIAKGVIVRPTRVVRRVREIRRREVERTAKLAGLPLPEKEDKVIYKPFATVVTKGLDACAKWQMEFAADIAKQRSASKRPGSGMKLRRSDLELAQKWIVKLAKK